MQGACENTTNSLNNGDDNSEIIKLVEESHNSVVGPGSKGASQSHSGQTKTRKDEISRGKGKELLDNEILPKCKRLLINAKEQDRSFFKLLSPHISDSQCQIHSVFILGMLLNCYNSKEFSYDIERLRDERLLSYAVLFSLLKHEAKDKTGLITYNRSLPDLGEITTQSGTKISVRCQQRSIVKAKREFNLNSINNMKSLATGKFKEILDNCNAAIRHSGKELKLLPCYATFRVTLRYMEEKNLPIIISLVRIRKMNKDNSIELVLNSKDVFFYEFQKNKDKFCFKEEESLSAGDKKHPTIVFSCFSLASDEYLEECKDYVDNEQLPSKKFLINCDIRHLLMLSGAGHSQLKEDAKLPFGEKNAKSYAEGLYEKYSDESVRQEEHSLKSSWYSEPTNILGDYNKYYKLAEKFGALNAPYAKSEKQGKSESESDNTIRVTLKNEDTFFAARHVYVSNYLCELEYIKDQDISTKLDNIQIINLDDKKEVLSKVRRELGF